MSKDYVLIGVDGGASKVSAWEVQVNANGTAFSLGEAGANRSYTDIPGFIADFKPVPIPTQLEDQSSGETLPTDDEIQQEAVYVEAAALVIEDIVKQTGTKKVLVGLGMPGLKTTNKRGIAVVANGPRMLHYSDLLENRLKLSRVEFLAPIFHLGSDADYCGIGENFASNGAFVNTENAYYLGGGTGVADALKLNGALLPFDLTKEWLAKSWEMKSPDGRSLERFTSAGGIQSIYAEISGNDIETLNSNKIFPIQIAELASNGDSDAINTFALVVEQLSLLLYERITTLYSGWQATFEFMNPNRDSLNPDHPYRKLLLKKIVMGQRLGELMQTGPGKQVLLTPMLLSLYNQINDSDVLDDEAKLHYSNLDTLLQISQLREAPGLGAGVDAYQNYKKEV